MARSIASFMVTVEEAAPEMARIEVEGVAEMTETGPLPAGDSLVQIGLRCPSELEGDRG